MRSVPGRDLTRALAAEPRSWRYDELVDRWSRGAVRAAIRSGDIQRILPARYASAEHAESLLVRAHAATEALGNRSFVIGRAAISLVGLGEADPNAIVVCASRGARPPEAPWLRAWRTDHTVPGRMRSGIRVSAVPDAVVTSFDDLRRDDAAALLFRAVQRELASPRALRNAASRWRPIKSRSALLQAIADAEAGCESILEAHGLHHVFTGTAFDHWVRQHRLMLDGVGVRLDMYDPRTRTAVELDGDSHHSSPEARGNDVRRDALLASHGILTVRFTSRDLRRHPDWCRGTALRASLSRAQIRVA